MKNVNFGFLPDVKVVEKFLPANFQFIAIVIFIL